MKIKRFCLGLLIICFIAILYKCFILLYFKTAVDENGFPNNKNISNLTIKNNGMNNENFGDLKLYIPDGYEVISDISKNRLVSINCKLYVKDFVDEANYSSFINVCYSDFSSLRNLEHYDIHNTLFPYLDVYSTLEKYNINDVVDLIKYYEDNANLKSNIFTKSSLIKINYIAKRYTDMTLGLYDEFYYFKGDLKGYLYKYESKSANYYTIFFLSEEHDYSITVADKSKSIAFDQILDIVNSFEI